MGTDSISTTLDGQTCTVYFFTSWSTYSHPVTPIEPLLWEDALMRDNYYRAWMCQEHGEERFVLFERINNQRKVVASGSMVGDLPTQVGSFELIEDGIRISAGNPITCKEAFLRERFLNRGEASNAYLEQLAPVVDLSYRYHYDTDGLLRTVTIVNIEGKTSILNMMDSNN
ncbi:MAG: hypothetical protein L3K24_17295 [Gammaproteobacteria bacterium]|nr:hypothetical protein [Gammaproteobacteria bacterium]